ncbi:MAG: hypothetical protein H5T74_06490 [Actinobacteria bacterium]|nr:hypothetical protein [Actinomycetota bacterium]
MQEAVAGAEDRVEFEIRGGAWEGVHAVVFYVALTMAVLATAGVLRVYLGIACIVLLFYSMLAIFSSPRFIVIDKGGISLLKYHFFLPRRVALPRDALEGVEVVESPRLPAPEGERGSRHDLSYYVRVYLTFSGGKRLKVFRSGMTGAPADNRRAAFLVAQALAEAADLPVSYTRRGIKNGTEAGETGGR